MLDVHPPEHTPHSWRDFLIHIATIVVGLLIAVGLEQAVELLHHRHQRHELLEQLDAEHRQVAKDAEADAGADEVLLNWQATQIEAMQAIVLRHERYQVPASPGITAYNIPHDPVWKAAKASGLTSVLAQQDVIVNSEPDTLLDHLDAAIDGVHDMLNTRMISACGRLPVLPGTMTLDYDHADIHELKDCVATTMTLYSSLRYVFNLESYIVGCERAVMAGETDIDRINDSEVNALKVRSARLRPAPLPH